MNISRLKKASLIVLFLAAGFVRSVVAQNFNFTVQPDSLTLVPGQQASFVITVEPFDGFTNQVTLSFTNLPSGVTASFSPQTVTPPATSILNLNATTNAQTGAFVLNITGVGGGITNVTTANVSVSFGLLPICYGAIQGVATDSITKKPVVGATVNIGNFYVQTDTNGFFIVTNLPLSGSQNLPELYNVNGTSNGYYSATAQAYAVCDATNTANLVFIPEESGSISGHVTIEGSGPLTNAEITAEFYPYQYSATTDSNGFYQFQSLQLANNNASAYYTLTLQTTGFWQYNTNTYVQANSNSVIDIAALAICYDTLSGNVVYGDTGKPATNANITISTYQNVYATTDGNGNFTVTNVELGYNNVPTSAGIGAYAPGYYQAGTNIALSGCGQSNSIGTLTLPAIPPPASNNYGNVTGFVYDIQTKLPITNATVDIFDVNYTSTDTNGAFSMTNVPAGMGSTTNAYYFVQSYADGYFSGGSNIIVYANETTNIVIYLLREGFGGISGATVDALTGLPVPGVSVTGNNFGVVSGSNGSYATGPIMLNSGNTPTYEGIQAQKAGYWAAFTNTYITNGITNIVNIEMLQVCQGATVVGNVINALTQTPITNATISTYSGGLYLAAQTDTNGDFIITNLIVGNNNSPIQNTLTASAPGFNPQSKTVTIFCDATISTSFGVPETNFGSIQGFVTNVLTGQAISNVFIGSSFGGATSTDTNGYYLLNQVPLSANGSNRVWTVTAIPNGFPSQTKSVDVFANTTNELDFGFGQPLTELVISATGTPNPVLVGSNVTYSIVLTNYKADATNVVLTDILPAGVTFIDASVTNSPGGFGIPVQSNGIVTLSGSNLGSNAGVVLLITVTANQSGGLTNTVTVTSDTPDFSPNSSNHTAIVLGTAQSPQPLRADVGITMTGTPNPVLASNQLTYNLVVDNQFGPDTATSVIVTDSLPANVTFGSVSVSQGAAALVSNKFVIWNVGSIAFGGSASGTIVVLPLQVGQVDNSATVGLGVTTPPVTDNDPDNDSAEVFTTVTTPTITTGTIQYSDITFNEQTGLFQQQVTYFNQPPQAEQKLGEVAPPATAVRLLVLGLPSGVQLYNATGASNGVPYVEYDNTVPSGGSVQFG
ncbi:MAG TPA: hypothetical protein VGO67_22895, partial [Verrucomicrobiae bacterium]